MDHLLRAEVNNILVNDPENAADRNIICFKKEDVSGIQNNLVNVIAWRCFEINVPILSFINANLLQQRLLPHRLIEVFTRQKVYEGSGILED